MVGIPLTSAQACVIHGWWTPKATLTWTDVTKRPDLTMRELNEAYLIPYALLYSMQNDITQWIRADKVGLQECPRLGMWGAHPVKHFKASLGDLLGLGWRADQLRSMNVTYADLTEAGMTHDTMAIFRFTLYEWSLLGFSKADVADMMPATLGKLFKLTKDDVLRCLPK